MPISTSDDPIAAASPFATAEDRPPYPRIAIRRGRTQRVGAGHPWVYANELLTGPDTRMLPPGGLVTLTAEGRDGEPGEPLFTAAFNPHSLIAARIVARGPDRLLDTAWWHQRLEAAQSLRTRIIERPFYRLAHAEADGLPGLVIDRYGDVLVAQPNTAAAARAEPAWTAALVDLFQPRAIVLRGDAPSRTLEGLSSDVRVVHGALDGPVPVEEQGLVWDVDVRGGQKTGWFFDQRENRALVAGLAAGRTMLDAYAFMGGFGLAAARAGARQVTLLDRSAPALDAAAAAADRAGLRSRVRLIEGEAFDTLEALFRAGERFEIVAVDPPPFARTAKDVAPALKGYRKLTRLAARLTAPAGLLVVASCSHGVTLAALTEAVALGLNEAGRHGRLLATRGAAMDHPVHPNLPESAYLKLLLLEVD